MPWAAPFDGLGSHIPHPAGFAKKEGFKPGMKE